MFNKDEVAKLLIETIGKERYIHSLGVAETAKKLAIHYGYDTHKAELAGILHDCAKFQDKDLLLQRVEEFGIILDGIMKKNHSLIHAPLGAKIAQKVYGVNDEDVLNAIRYHTTGKTNMTLLEKIIYIADYIEPGRQFSGIEDIRRMAYKNLERSLLMSMDNTIKYIIEKGWLIHPDTVDARNYLITNTTNNMY